MRRARRRQFVDGRRPRGPSPHHCAGSQPPAPARARPGTTPARRPGPAGRAGRSPRTSAARSSSVMTSADVVDRRGQRRQRRWQRHRRRLRQQVVDDAVLGHGRRALAKEAQPRRAARRRPEVEAPALALVMQRVARPACAGRRGARLAAGRRPGRPAHLCLQLLPLALQLPHEIARRRQAAAQPGRTRAAAPHSSGWPTGQPVGSAVELALDLDDLLLQVAQPRVGLELVQALVQQQLAPGCRAAGPTG